MSDYTPTTEEVREGYSAEYDGCDCENCQYDRIAFDRWFAEVKAQERERIATMLENSMNYLADAERNGQVDVVPGVERYRRIIAKIRKMDSSESLHTYNRRSTQ